MKTFSEGESVEFSRQLDASQWEPGVYVALAKHHDGSRYRGWHVVNLTSDPKSLTFMVPSRRVRPASSVDGWELALLLTEAAPDLLAAAVEVLDVYGTPPNNAPLERLRAAVAKARGE